MAEREATSSTSLISDNTKQVKPLAKCEKKTREELFAREISQCVRTYTSIRRPCVIRRRLDRPGASAFSMFHSSTGSTHDCAVAGISRPCPLFSQITPSGRRWSFSLSCLPVGRALRSQASHPLALQLPPVTVSCRSVEIPAFLLTEKVVSTFVRPELFQRFSESAEVVTVEKLNLVLRRPGAWLITLSPSLPPHPPARLPRTPCCQ